MKRQPKERIHPRTVKEAEHLRNQAIEKIDFEAAAEFHEDLEGLALLDREGALGEIATQYLAEKARLADSLDRDVSRYDADDDAEIEHANQNYEEKFAKLEGEQTQELEELFTHWRVARHTVQAQADQELELQLRTAKELARQTKFKEAVQTRDHAFHQKTIRLAQANGEVDSHYENLVRGMLDRHQTALDAFVRKRKCETRTHKMLQAGAAKSARRAFAVDNAANIFEITRLTTPELTLPLALAHQTVHAKPEQRGPPPEFESDVTLRGKPSRFQEALAGLEQNVHTSCPLEQSTSPIRKRTETKERERRRSDDRKRRLALETPRKRFIPRGNIFLQILPGKSGETTAGDGLVQTAAGQRPRRTSGKTSQGAPGGGA
jgi:hypothetical protein